MRQSSRSYIKNHERFFFYPINTLSYPVGQLSAVGFVRSPLDRQKLYDWMTGLAHKAIKYGQVPFT